MKYILILLFLTAVSAGFAEVAVIPYRVENASEYFRADTGNEYAKLLGVAMALKKGVEVYSPRDLESDMKNFSISPEETITRNQLDAFGRGRYVDLVAAGTLEKRGSSYIAEGTLYSVSQQRIVSRSRVKAGSLYECAEKEASELFYDSPDRGVAGRDAVSVEMAVVFDASYNASREWEGIKSGIIKMAGSVSDGWEFPVRMYLLPCADAYAPLRAVKAVSTPAALRSALDSVKPKGGAGGEAFNESLNYAVRSVPWTRGSSKILVVISNSPVKKAPYAERHAMAAKKKNIAVYTVSLGKQGRDDADVLRQLAVIGKGRYYAAAYRQRLYDVSGRNMDIFMEAGRLFKAGAYGAQWKDGLYEVRGDPSLRHGKPRAFLTEIDFDERRREVTPYTMGAAYPDLADTGIINADALENNADSLLEGIGEAYHKIASRKAPGKSIARVLLSEDTISLWVRINSPADLEFFRKQESSGFYFPLGITVQKKADEPYGLTFSPNSYVTRIPGDHIPGMVRAGLKEIIEKPDYYTDHGLLRPPVWFVNVKVERLEGQAAGRDIRDER